MKFNKMPSIEVLLSMSEEELKTLCMGDAEDNGGLQCNTCPFSRCECSGNCYDYIKALKEYISKNGAGR